jgi:biotin carboxyl carrier protein
MGAMNPRRITLRFGDEEEAVEVGADGHVTIAGELFRVSPAGPMLRVEGATGGAAWAAGAGNKRWVYYDGCVYELELQPEGRRRTMERGSLAAPMPATVREIRAGVGDVVARGDTLVVLEAMKMELPIRANVDGTVAAIHCQVGELVAAGRNLVELTGRIEG